VLFYVDEVTDLRKIDGSFDLIVDIGCFHSISLKNRQAYLSNVNRLLDRQGSYMLYAFLKINTEDEGSGIDEEEIMKLSKMYLMVYRKDGSERGIRPSTWMIFRNKGE
jgi:cyclopropane fatty-acyl-phospholipid synthase-like methyltransferase